MLRGLPSSSRDAPRSKKSNVSGRYERSIERYVAALPYPPRIHGRVELRIDGMLRQLGPVHAIVRRIDCGLLVEDGAYMSVLERSLA